MIFYCIIWL